MSSQLFPLARAQLEAGTLDWTAGTIRALLLPPSVVFDYYSEEYLADISPGARIAVSDPLTNRAVNSGWYTAAPINLGIVFDTRKVAQAVLFLDTGDENTSLLIAHIDDEGIVGEPFVPMGVEYFLYPDATRGGFFFVSKIVEPVLSVGSVGTPSIIRVSWAAPVPTPSLPVVAYFLYRSINDAEFEQIAELPPETTQYDDDEEFEDGSEIRYYVVARLSTDSIDEGTIDVESNIDAIGISAPIITPSVLTAEQTGAGGDIDLEWTAAVPSFGDIDGYRVYRRVNGGAYTEIADVSSATLTYTDDDAFSEDDVVDYYVEAYAGLTNAVSNTDSVTVVGPATMTGSPSIGAAVNETHVGAAMGVTNLDGPITWSIEGGALPTGWDINASTGAVGGVATGAGSYTYTIRATGTDPVSGDPAFVEEEFTTDIGTIISLLHFGGSAGDTTFPDETGKSWTRTGGVIIATDANAIAGVSADFDGMSDYLTTPDHADWHMGSNDFTFQAFFTPDVSQPHSQSPVFAQRNNVSSNHAITWRLDSNGGVGLSQFRTSSTGSNTNVSVNMPYSAGQRRHYAITRRGTRLYVHVDGVFYAGADLSPGYSVFNSSAAVRIGMWDASPPTSDSGYAGRIEEFKVVKGAALYAEDETFTPPTIASDFPVA